MAGAELNDCGSEGWQLGPPVLISEHLDQCSHCSLHKSVLHMC